MDVNVPLLRSAFLLLLLTHFSPAQHQMVAPSDPIIAPVGSTAVLPCHLDPVKERMAVEWGRPDLTPRYVHIRRDGVNLFQNQNSLYQGRTALNEKKLKNGDMSLELSRVKLSDNGTYRCYVPEMDASAHVQLLVVSASSPSLSLTKGPGGSPVLQCSSGGWYPEPELQWLDSEGRVLPGGPPQTRVMEELYSVSSRLTVEQGHGSTFTCRVSQSSTKETRETHINISDDFMEVSSCSVPWTLFSLGFCLLLLIPVAFFLWKFKFSSKSKKAEAVREEEQRPLMTSEEKSLDPILIQTKYNELFKHNEDLKRIEEELQYVNVIAEKLKETQRFLTNFKVTLHKSIHQLKSDKEEKEKKKGKEEKKKHEKLMKIQIINMQLSDYENQSDNTQRNLERTKVSFKKTSERRDKLETDKKELTIKVQNLKKLLENSVEVEDEGKAANDANYANSANDAKGEVEVKTSHEQKDKSETEPEKTDEQGSRSEEARCALTSEFSKLNVNESSGRVVSPPACDVVQTGLSKTNPMPDQSPSSTKTRVNRDQDQFKSAPSGKNTDESKKKKKKKKKYNGIKIIELFLDT